MTLELLPELDHVWTQIDGRVRTTLSDYLRHEMHCITPEVMRYRAGELAGWRASGTATTRPASERRPITVVLTLDWDARAGGGNGGAVLTVDPGPGHTDAQIASLLGNLRLLKQDMEVRLATEKKEELSPTA